MLRLNKILTIILLLSLVLLVSCNEKTNVSPNTDSDTNLKPYKPMGKEILSPIDIPYVVENPIEFNRIEVSDNDKYQHNYFEISGLIDKKVEEDINKKIKSLFEEMLPYATGEKIPPYRGMKSAINPDGKIANSSLSLLPNYNYNNVLSVSVYLNGTYYHSNDRYIHFSMSDGLNFDLNTGNTFFIEDVFTNDVDGLEIVNRAIMKEINKRRLDPFDSHELYSSNLIAPFNGINYDQKFLLNPDGINVILDYDNPEFYVDFTNTIVIIPFYSHTDYIGITKRFYDENNSIFVKEPINKRFLRDDLAESTSEGETIDINGAQWYTYISYPKELPLFNEILKNIKDNQREEIHDYIEENPVQHVEQDIHAYRVGPYVSVGATYSLIRKDNPDWVEESYVYSKTGELITLKDLFIKGYDYEGLIISSIEKNLKNYRASNTPEPKFFLDGLNFKIENSYISFVTKPYRWDKDNIHPINFSFTYEEIGYENLKIFD